MTGLGNERQMNVVRYASEDIVWAFREKRKKFIRELHSVANYVNTSPNSLGRMDKHKITFINKQMNPSMIGKQDLVESTKDVGQSGVISPWGDISALTNVNVNKYPNIKFELYKFIEENFPMRSLRFNANTIEEYNAILDKIACSVYIDLDYHVPEGGYKAIQDEGDNA